MDVSSLAPRFLIGLTAEKRDSISGKRMTAHTHGEWMGCQYFITRLGLPAEGLVEDADELTLGIEADDAFRLALQRAHEQEGDAANLEDVTDVAVLVY